MEICFTATTTPTAFAPNWIFGIFYYDATASYLVFHFLSTSPFRVQNIPRRPPINDLLLLFVQPGESTPSFRKLLDLKKEKHNFGESNQTLPRRFRERERSALGLSELKHRKLLSEVNTLSSFSFFFLGAH